MDIPDILLIVDVIIMIICRVCFSAPFSKIAIVCLVFATLLSIIRKL